MFASYWPVCVCVCYTDVLSGEYEGNTFNKYKANGFIEKV